MARNGVPMKLRYLRVNPKNDTKPLTSLSTSSGSGSNPQYNGVCADEMQAVLSCWRLNGVDAGGCADAVKILAACARKAVCYFSFFRRQPSLNHHQSQA